MQRFIKFLISVAISTISFSSLATASVEPTLVSPANGSSEVNKPVEMVWNMFPMTNFYKVQVDNDLTFLSPLVDTSITGLTDTILTTSAPNYGSSYFWRVRSFYFNGVNFVYSDWSSIWQFSVRSEVPLLLSPTNDAVDVTPPPTLDWREVGGAVSYHLQVDDNFVFSEPEVDVVLGPTESQYEATELEDGTRYFWRVQTLYYVGLIPTWSSWSLEWNFTLKTTTPDLVSPADGAVGVCHPVELTWDPVPGATRYRYMVGDSPDFIGSNQGGDAFTTSITLNAIPLDENSQYWWKIRARIDGIDQDWCQPWSFTTNPFAPAYPELVLPADGADELVEPVYLDWNTVSHAINYHLQVSGEPDFSTLEIDLSSTFTNYTCNYLDDGVTYYWRVKAQDDCEAWSEYSPARHFVMAGGSAVDDNGRPEIYEYSLAQNHPNPFNPQTTIEFSLASRSRVRIDIVNLLGENIATLVDKTRQPGSHRVIWNGLDNNDAPCASGIYFYRIVTDDFTETKKMVLMK